MTRSGQPRSPIAPGPGGVASFGRRWPAIVALGCLLWWPPTAAAEEAGASVGAAAATLAQAVPLPARRGGAAQELPQIAPRPRPAPEAPEPTTAAPTPPDALRDAPRFPLRDITIDGNTVLDPKAIDDIVAPHRGKLVTIADLEEIRRRLTLLYIERGYINSGVTVPNQNVADGVVKFHAVEGKITAVEITGTDAFAPDYFSARLERGLRTPFNVHDAEILQQILLQDPLVKRLNIELLPGLVPGEARMRADVTEGSRFGLTTQIANDQSPTVGEIRGQIQGTANNLLGYGDLLTAQYGRSQGLNDGFVSYSLPLASDDTRLNLRYDRNGTLVVSPALVPLNITSDYSSVSVGLTRPFHRTAEEMLVLGVSAERRQAQSFLLGTPFPFTGGASDDGKTNVTALRFTQSWLDRDVEHAFALRSTLSVGLHSLGSTVLPPGTSGPMPTSKFVSWLGQAQYVRRIFSDWEGVVRSNIQIANHPLFPIEQFALGGIDSVRGYRQYLTVTDDAFFASGELRIPVAKLRIPYLADSDEAGVVQFIPFYDYGRGWNIDRPTPSPPDISSVGAGLRWLIGSGITAELYYGKALRHVPIGTALQDRGFHFRLTTSLY